MGVTFQVFVSTENTRYMSWQTELFCFSALSMLGTRPTMVVHETSTPLRAEFIALRDRGFPLIQAPSFSYFRNGIYLPRNEIGSLLTIASSSIAAEYILFCEPDMLFVQQPMYSDGVSGEFYRYLDYGQRHIVRAAKKIGLAEMTEELNNTSRIGVPYLIPTRDVKRVASRWIEVLEAFDLLDWIDIMYAFGFALKLEGIQPQATHLMDDNLHQKESLRSSIIHYCYGDSAWNKRSFVNRSPLEGWNWFLPRAKQGSILREIVRQIRRAKKFYSDKTLIERFFSILPAESLTNRQ